MLRVKGIYSCLKRHRKERSRNKDLRSTSGNRTRNLPHRKPFITDHANPCTLSNLSSNAWSAVSEQDRVGTSYIIIIMYLNIVIISYYILLLLHYKHLQISSYIPIHHHISPYTPLHRHIPLCNTIYPYTTPYTPIQQHIPLYNSIYPYTTPYTPKQHHIPIYNTINPYTSP